MPRSPAPHPAPPAVDFEWLRALTMGDAALRDAAVAAFLRELPRYREALPRAAADAAEFRALLHRLRGACLAVAAQPLAAAIAQVRGRHRWSPPQRAAAATRLLRELAAVEAALAAEGGEH